MLGTPNGTGSLDAWGTKNEDGSLTLVNDYLSGKIYAYDANGNDAEVTFNHEGLSVNNSEIEIGEVIVIDLE